MCFVNLLFKTNREDNMLIVLTIDVSDVKQTKIKLCNNRLCVNYIIALNKYNNSIINLLKQTTITIMIPLIITVLCAFSANDLLVHYAILIMTFFVMWTYELVKHKTLTFQFCEFVKTGACYF